MTGYKLVVLSNPVAGQETEYNDWYSNRHLADILRIPGFCAARRYALKVVRMGEIIQQYLAIYEMDANELSGAREALSAMGTTDMEISPALDLESVATGLFEPCGSLHSSEGPAAGPFISIALTDSVEGRDEEFNRWYTDTHIRELMASGGHSSAERYRLQGSVGRAFENRYLAVYSLTGADWAAVEDQMRQAATVRYTPSDAGRRDAVRLAVYEACSPRVVRV